MKFLILLFCFAFALTACGKKEPSNLPNLPQLAPGEVKLEGKEIVSSLAEQSKRERDAFVSKTQKDMDQFTARVAALKKRALEATGESKSKLEQKIQKLEQEQKSAEGKLAELKSAIGEKWKELKAGVIEVMDRLNQSILKAES